MKLFALVTLFALCSCAHHIKTTNKLSLGMDRLEVEKLLGEPEITKASNPNTYLTYKFRPAGVSAYLKPHETENYILVFSPENKLIQFGHARDFKDETNINVYHH